MNLCLMSDRLVVPKTFLVYYECIQLRSTEMPNTTLIKVKWELPKYRIILENPELKNISTDKEYMVPYVVPGTQQCYKNNLNEVYRFRMRMKISGQNNELIEFFYMAPRPVYLQCDLVLVTHLGNNCIIASQEFQWIEEDKWQSLGLFTNAEELTRLCRNLEFNFFVRDDKCFDESKNIFYTSHENEAREFDMQRAKFIAEEKLNHDLQKLVIDHMFSDVTIKSNDGIEICLHKSMLSARSPVFHTYFKQDENLTILKSPFDAEVLQVLFDYIYTGNTANITKKLEELLRVADYYQLDELKNLCKKALGEKLLVKNVIET